MRRQRKHSSSDVRPQTLSEQRLLHEFCSSNGPQYGVPSPAILVARSLSRRQDDALQLAPCRAICHACVLNNFVVTSRDTLEINF